MGAKPNWTAQAPGGGETILVAEDEPIVRDVVVRILRRAGYAILEAEDGRRAVELLKESPDHVALALLDVMMPGMGGREAYRRIRELKPHIAVLFATGYDPASDQSEFITREGLHLLEKPFEPSVLLQTVREVLDEASVAG